MDDGAAEPLGVHLTQAGATIAIPAPGAEAIDLCVFDATGAREVARWRLPGRTGDVFHGALPGLAEGTRYGLRAHGPAALRFGPREAAARPLGACDRPAFRDASVAVRRRRRQRACDAEGGAGPHRFRQRRHRPPALARGSSTNCMCAASPARIPTFPKRSAAPSLPSRIRPPSRI
jgi:hypothetical protein